MLRYALKGAHRETTPNLKTQPSPRPAAYSLIEVLVAGSILVIAAAAAAAMALAVSSQQEANTRIARALVLQEQAARLYHLGMTPADIDAVLPWDPAVDSLTHSPIPPATEFVDTIPMEKTTSTLVYKPFAATSSWSAGSWTGGDPSAQRSNSMTLVRPITR